MKSLKELQETKLDMLHDVFNIIMTNWDVIQYNIAPNLAEHDNYNYGVELMNVKEFGENWIDIEVVIHGTTGSYERVYTVNDNLSVYLRRGQ